MKVTDKDLDKILKDMDLEEPSLSFNRKVMDLVLLEAAPVSLATKVDSRIIYGIASVFLLGIVGLLGYVFSTAELKSNISEISWRIDFAIDRPNYPLLLKGFLFIDLVVILFYFDRFLRRGVKSVGEETI